MRKLRTGDPVIVIAGKHKGKISSIEKIQNKTMKRNGKILEQLYVYVKGVNEVKKAVKGQGFVTKTLPMHSSNVMYYSEKHGKAAKVGISVDAKGKKKRQLKKLNETL